MAKFFVSHTGLDTDWASWIGFELEGLGHEAFVDRWEISGGDDIAAWMDARLDAADHCVCVCSSAYFGKTYSDWERRSALWVSKTKRSNFVLPIIVAPCELPGLMSSLSRCNLFEAGANEAAARRMLHAFLTPSGKPATPPHFPGAARGGVHPAFPGPRPVALSNVPISVPRHFMGRDNALEAIEKAFSGGKDSVAITALHGLRGVGKTTLAAAYAEREKHNYRATWWIRAQAPETMRADLVALGVRLGWVAADDNEEPALAATMERLRYEGEGVLLIFDNAIDANALRPYLPKGGVAKMLATSNSHAWRGVAHQVEILIWPKDIGGDYLIARTGRKDETDDAEALSHALGGLPLAHEQAGAYCERLEVGFGEYLKRFEAMPDQMLDAAKDAPADYHDRLTVAKTFALAIEQASALHPAAEALIVHAAFLAEEPIPLFFFSEGREKFSEPLFSALANDGLLEAIAALRAFALVEREMITDERDASIKTDTIRLHRLVRLVAATRREGAAKEDTWRSLAEAMRAAYPDIFRDPKTWPLARRLNNSALALVGGDDVPPKGMEESAIFLLNALAYYRKAVLGDYGAALPMYEKAFEVTKRCDQANYSHLSAVLVNLGSLRREMKGSRNLNLARAHLERALAIQMAHGGKGYALAVCLSGLAQILEAIGGLKNLRRAKKLLERAILLTEAEQDGSQRYLSICFSNLACVLQGLGGAANLARASEHLSRALAILEKTAGTKDPEYGKQLENLGLVLEHLGGEDNLARASEHLVQAEKILRATLGDEHPITKTAIQNYTIFRVKHPETVPHPYK